MIKRLFQETLYKILNLILFSGALFFGLLKWASILVGALFVLVFGGIIGEKDVPAMIMGIVLILLPFVLSFIVKFVYSLICDVTGHTNTILQQEEEQEAYEEEMQRRQNRGRQRRVLYDDEDLYNENLIDEGEQESLYFKGCNSYEEAKARFKKLSKVLHPDEGGDKDSYIDMKKEFKEMYGKEIDAEKEKAKNTSVKKPIQQLKKPEITTNLVSSTAAPNVIHQEQPQKEMDNVVTTNYNVNQNKFEFDDDYSQKLIGMYVQVYDNPSATNNQYMSNFYIAMYIEKKLFVKDYDNSNENNYERNIDWLKKNAVEISLSLRNAEEKIMGDSLYSQEYFEMYKWFKRQVGWL